MMFRVSGKFAKGNSFSFRAEGDSAIGVLGGQAGKLGELEKQHGKIQSVAAKPLSVSKEISVGAAPKKERAAR